jgi:hypothetical protein
MKTSKHPNIQTSKHPNIQTIKLLSLIVLCLFFLQSVGQTQPWNLNGNNTLNTVEKLGLIDPADLQFLTEDETRLTLKSDGALGLGITDPGGAFELQYSSLGIEGGSIITHNSNPTSVINPNNVPLVVGQGLGGPPTFEGIALPAMSYLTTNFSPPGQAPFNTKPLFWVRQQQASMWSFNTTPGQYETEFIVMPDGSVGIGTARPRAALDVLGSNKINYPSAIIGSLAPFTYAPSSQFGGQGMFNTQGVQFITRLGNNGFNLISQAGDQGMFFSDGKGTDGSNLDGTFIIAPWAQDAERNDIGGLRMDKFGNVELRGNLRTTKVNVDAKWWPDFVFAEDYPLQSLREVEAYIAEHHHLPNVPSEAEVLENGIDVAEMQSIQQKKIEELTLYTIAQEKQLAAQQQRLEELEALVGELLKQ